ncbi:hypothetical protein [Carboxylicivirga sp. N1Y90]|uniref:hypothetical protein n=1 Tax=Carboxylicivirga fragile TaxID=3417571 RepID=UPI003D33B059|nr:hypothetical protein [Marinilabiliaceae bacterium N1Y90]
MASYYLELKKDILGERSIHVLGCDQLTSIEKELLLGDFTSSEGAYKYAQWHFPHWNIQVCKTCQSHENRMQIAG